MTTPEKALKDLGAAVVDFAPFLDGSDKQGVADNIITSSRPVVQRVLHPAHGCEEVRGAAAVYNGLSCVRAVELGRSVEFDILGAFALGLGLPEEYFHQFHRAADNHSSLVYYPSVPAEDVQTESLARLAAHTDQTSISLLLQDESGGLEFEDGHVPGLFRSVPPIPGALVVNVGDFMMHWSNDTIRSAVHRVRPLASTITPDGMVPARYSIGYDFDTVVDCIPGTWNAEWPKKYKPLSVREYLMERRGGDYLKPASARLA
ncbi:hypothetical protein C8R43DRAFT_959973 [Mycena crocata]|nr:hypothetical protein C8R43DRAFT_959973 [Mycena crocata]